MTEQWAIEAAARGVCNCPHDYPHVVHNEWCPKSLRYVPRFHWHDKACHTQDDRNSPYICGKRAGIDPA